MRQQLAIALGVLMLTGTAYAADVTDRDSKFLKTEAQGTAYELAIAKLAEQKATKPDIQSYAKMIVSDHEQLNAQLRQLASTKGVELPSSMTDKQQSELKRLQNVNSSAFDSAYKEETVRINEEGKKEDQAEMTAVSDPEIRSYVQKLQASDSKHYEAGKKL